MTAEHRDAPAVGVPEHVPERLVHDFDFRNGLGEEPHGRFAGLHEGPPVFYSPHSVSLDREGGCWVVTRAADVRTVLAHPDIFSSTVQGEFLARIGETARLPPLDVDPPDHQGYRAVIAPLFSARRMVELEPKMRARCVELIERFAPSGECEFISAFATRFPSAVFIDLMGLPGERLDDFMGWARAFIHGESIEIRVGAIRTALGYFRALYRDPGELDPGSLVRQLIAGEIAGTPLDEDQFSGLAFLVFNAGLDTVVSTLGFVFRHLARHPDLQEQLRREPAAIPRHVEEMMRLFAPVTPQRAVVSDTELGGVTMRRGDRIALSLAAASRDPELFAEPSKMDAARNPNPHLAFGSGIHRCVGAQLARRDIAIAIEEFVSRIGSFGIAPGTTSQATGGAVLSLDRLHLDWDRGRDHNQSR